VSDTHERGHHFMSILEEGKRFTAEVLRENEGLRMQNLKLRDDMRAHDVCKQELETLRTQLSSVESENREFADRYVRIEKQNGDLASLYVATYNLHATLKLDEVVACIREIVINLIGSEMFGIYAVDEAGDLRMLGHEGLDGAEHERLRPSGVIDQALRSGQAVAVEPSVVNGSGGPIACAPLLIGGQVLGVIVIYRLLDHKETFETIDRELLDMLAGHAATALYSARLHARAERKLTTLEGFLDLLRLQAPALER
jgi:hypothetical protein